MPSFEAPSKGVVIPLVVDGAILLMGAYQLGNINTTLKNLENKILPVSEARIAVMERDVENAEHRIEYLENILRQNDFVVPPRVKKQ
jgi:hypothetical protein